MKEYISLLKYVWLCVQCVYEWLHVANTCSSLIRSWRRALSSGPCRPPLLQLINTTNGNSGDSAGSVPSARAKWWNWTTVSASKSLTRIASLMASLIYSGNAIFFFSSSLGIRTPASVQPRMDSITDDRPDAEARFGVPGESMRGDNFTVISFRREK